MRKIVFCKLMLPLLLFSRSGVAQVPASQEAHHKVILDNEYIRVLDGHIPAHDTTPAHVHSTNGVVVFLSSSPLAIQLVGAQPVLSTVRPGDLKYVNYGDKPVTHVVWTDGPGELHFLVVELKRPGAGEGCPRMKDKSLGFLWEEKGVRAYAVDWTSVAEVKLPATGCGYYLINVAGQEEVKSGEARKVLPAGAGMFFRAGEGVDVRGSGRGVVLELR